MSGRDSSFGGSSGASFGGRGDDRRDVDSVREATDIVRLVGEHVALKARGREYVGLCPFHDDHNPSMAVVPGKGIFHCFVCGTGGDCFTFVQRFHSMDFREALEFLAEKAGVRLTPRRSLFAGGGAGGGDGGAGEGLTRAALVSVSGVARDFFRAIYQHAEHGRAAREVVARRGISAEMVEQFQIGAAPDRWDGLVTAAQTSWKSKGLDLAALEELGLVKKREQGGGHYDLLRHRLIFPIHDQIGRVVAFGGRKMRDEDEPKYLNSPDSRLFHKSRTMYGLSLAARPVQQEGFAIVCEGYTDTIALHQAGFRNAVATLGTALTREHAVMLARLCAKVVLLFDGDEAGQRAADRAVEVFFAAPMDVTIVTLASHTDAKDPDELLKREGGAAILKKALAAGTDILEYRAARLRARTRDLGPTARTRAVEEEIERLVELGLTELPPLRYQKVLAQVSRLEMMAPGVVERAIGAARAAKGGKRGMNAGSGAGGGAGNASGGGSGGGGSPALDLDRTVLSPRERALGCLLSDGALARELEEDEADVLEPSAYAKPEDAVLVSVAAELVAEGSEPGLAAVLGATREQGVRARAVLLSEAVDRLVGHDAGLRRELWRSTRSTLRSERRAAERTPARDGDELRVALERRREALAKEGPRRGTMPRPIG